MNESDIERLLREQAPETPVRPGLETRIRASLRMQEKQRRVSPAWIAAPVAAVIVLVVAVAPKKPQPEVVDTPPPVLSFPDEIESTIPVNTLGNEAVAIRNDAERTGRFLLDCLPSMTRATP